MINLPPLHLPCNKFNYDKTTLVQKITAPHNSAWTKMNNFNILRCVKENNLKDPDFLDFEVKTKKKNQVHGFHYLP